QDTLLAELIPAETLDLAADYNVLLTADNASVDIGTITLSQLITNNASFTIAGITENGTINLTVNVTNGTNNFQVATDGFNVYIMPLDSDEEVSDGETFEVDENKSVVIVSGETSEIVANNSIPENKTISIKLNEYNETGTKITLTHNITLCRNVTEDENNISYVLELPKDIVISSTNSSWNKELILPTIVTTKPTVDGAKSVDVVIKVGSYNSTINFSKPVKLIIPNQNGKKAAFKDLDGNINKITYYSTLDALETALNTTSEGYTYVGNDMVILTKHFTEYIAYTQEDPVTPSSSGSSRHHSSSASESITTSNLISSANIVYANLDKNYATELKSSVNKCTEGYTINDDTIIVGGPLANPLAKAYMNEFAVSITNSNPGENKGVIQMITVKSEGVGIISEYTVVLLAGSDRFGTQAAVEYFKTLEEVPEEPIYVEWVDGKAVLVK
ncbi:S-layer protein, partial [Methanococcus voltae]|uniref:S-layer protein n=1 Tax=Methanococcus voltae TaxID=2188 RepID=UPI0021677132